MKKRFCHFFSNLFCEKSCVFFKNGETCRFSFSPAFQVVSACFFLAFFSWILFASFFFFTARSHVHRKDQKVMNVSNSYAILLSEVELHKNRLTNLKKQYEKNQQLALQLLKAPDEEVFQTNEDARRFSQQSEGLKNEMSFMENKIEQLASAGDIQKRKAEALKESRLIYERDLALSELKTAKKRLKEAEDLVIDVQNAHQTALERMDELLGTVLSDTENNLAGVQKVLGKAGVRLGKLVEEVADKKMDGQGGPFIPEHKSLLFNQKNMDMLTEFYQRMSYLKNILELQEVLPLDTPIKGEYRISCAFGTRSDPFTGRKARHHGIDLAAVMNTPVVATADGRVLRAMTPNGSYGNFVEIQHKMGFRTRYAHLNKVLVKRGDKVKKGDVIGLLGNTGRSTGPHLHYEIRVNKKVVNPYRFIRTKRLEVKGNENG